MQTGCIIVNADDWGRDVLTTDRIFECHQRGAISSVSAMVFMEDSERSAAMAKERGVDAGLHLNFTTPFSDPKCAATLRAQQELIGRYLLRHRLAQIVFHPGLASAFRNVVQAQLGEFRRLYGAAPARIDGHHHMHLCANVLIQRLLPAGTKVRRNFSFDRGQKSLGNLLYRDFVDKRLARRHQLTDYFFSLPPLEPQSRVKHIFSLGNKFVVEVETHPALEPEYRYLSEGEMFRQMGDVRMARTFAAAEPAGVSEAKQ